MKDLIFAREPILSGFTVGWKPLEPNSDSTKALLTWCYLCKVIPVLVINFNRPDKTRALLNALRISRPTKIYFAVDGPRNSDDVTNVTSVQRAIEGIDWPCQVNVRFRDENLGCGQGVIDAIDWVFEHEKSAVILEDDCLPSPSFMPYMAFCLSKFEKVPRVMMVSGLNELGRFWLPRSSYLYTLGGTWGWATWSDRWQEYDRDLRLLSQAPSLQPIRRLGALLPQRVRAILDGCRSVQAGQTDTWDYQWALTMMASEGLSVNPKVNLVSNIGVGLDATHTRSGPPLTPKTRDLQEPFCHNSRLELNYGYHWAVDLKYKVRSDVRRLGARTLSLRNR